MTQKRTCMLRRRKRFRAGLWGPLAALIVLMSASPGQAQDVDIHGFFSQGYLKSTGNNFLAQTKAGDFEFVELGLNFGTQVTDDLRFGLQLYARSLGNLGKFRPVVDWAFLDYSITDWFNLRAGRIKQPYGLFGEYQDLDLTRATVIMPQSVYFTGIRDLLVNFNGIQAYGNLDLEDWSLGNFDYQLCLGALLGAPLDGPESSMVAFFENDGYNAFTRTYAVGIEDLDNHIYFGSALQWNTPFEELTDYDWGSLILKFTMSFYEADITLQMNDEFIDELKLIGAADYNYDGKVVFYAPYVFFWVGSLEYTYENFIFTAEYTRYFSKFNSSANEVGTVPNGWLNQESFYVQASYRFSDWMQMAAYYSVQLDPDCRDGLNGRDCSSYAADLQNNPEQLQPRHDAWQKDLALALRFDVNDYWLVKFEAHFIDGTARVYETINPDVDYLERYWTMYGIKTTLTF